MTTEVTHQPARNRYVLLVDGAEVGLIDYHEARGALVMTHTEVDPSLRRDGLGGALVQGALDDVRQAGGQVVPACPFVASWIRDHPEYQSLVA